MAQSILAGLDALRLSHSPVPWPLPSTQLPPASSSSSSAHQSFAGTVTLNQLIYVPGLAEDLWARTRASLAASLDDLERLRGPRPEAVAAVKRVVETVQLSLDAFAAPGRTRTFNEAVVERKIGTLAESLHDLIPALDALVEYDTDEHTATVEQRMRVVAAAPVGPQRRRRHGAVTVDLVLSRSDPSAADAEPTPVMSLELKSPQASQGCDEPPGAVPSAGLFVRLEALLSEGVALSLDDLASDPPLASLLAKEIHVARTLGHHLFLLADGYSFMLGILTRAPAPPDDEHGAATERFNVLLSRLERIAPTPPGPNLFFLSLVAAFYPNLLDHHAALAETVAQRAAAAAPLESSSRRRSARLGVMPSPNVAASSLGPDEVNIVYPDGAILTLRAHEPLSSPSPSSSSLSSPFKVSSAPRPGNPSPSPSTSPGPLSTSPCTVGSAPRPRLARPRTSPIYLDYLFASSSAAHVYACTVAGRACVAKVSRRGFDGALEREAALLCAPEVVRLARAGDVARVVAVFMSAEGQIVVVEEDAGDALESWAELSCEQSFSLVLSLLRLHQVARLSHGDLAPRNVVLPPRPSSALSPSPSTSTRASPPPAPSTPAPRLIDLGHAEEHAQACAGRACPEVRDLVGELGLEERELDTVGRRAAAEGLTW